MRYETPLQWPDGVGRAEKQATSDFRMPPEKIREELEGSLRRLGASLPVVSMNLQLRQKDGKPWANDRGYVHDPGVAVYFQHHGQPHCIACDRWGTVFDNMHAIALTIEALRGIERWGSSEMQARSFQGFQALPPPADPWYTVLQVAPDTPLEVAEAAYKALARKAHPDAGGDAEQMQRLTAAIEEARRKLT